MGEGLRDTERRIRKSFVHLIGVIEGKFRRKKLEILAENLAIILIARLLIPDCWKSLYLKTKQNKQTKMFWEYWKGRQKLQRKKASGGNIWVDLWKIKREKEGIKILKVLTNLNVNRRGERKRKHSEGNKYVK